MTTPFEELQVYFGPEGPGAKKFDKLEHLSIEDGPEMTESGTVLDTENPILKALWAEWHITFWRLPEPPRWGFSPRSCAEAALLLPEACRQVNLRHASLPAGEVSYKLGFNQWWVATFPCPVAGHDHTYDSGATRLEKTCLKAEAGNWLDALAAVVLMREKEKP